MFACHIGELAAKLSAQIVNRPAPETSPHLPVLVINTHGQTVQDRFRTPCHLIVLSPFSRLKDAFSPEASSGKAELSVRGNSSYHFSKKSYRLELQDDNGNDRKAPLLGLPADSDWVLYASVTDRTFARNLLANELWRQTGRYAVQWRFVEVFVVTNSGFKELTVPNLDRPHPGLLLQEKEERATTATVTTTERLAEEMPSVLDALSVTNPGAVSLSFSDANNPVASALAGSYAGLYVLMEKIKRGQERVDIKRLRPEHATEPDITGGYIIKKDDQGRAERGLLTGQELKLRFEEPKETELTPGQRGWMTRYLDQFEKALFGLSFRDPENGYPKYLDADSFIDFHWLVEIAKNADGYWLSQYMHKDRGGRLTMGPVWDWDNAFCNPFFRNMWKTNGWRFEVAADPDYTWYRRLFEDPDFLQRYIDRWSELRGNILATSNVLALVDSIAGQVKEAQRRNELRWPAGNSSWFASVTNDLFTAELKWLKDWITDRLAWIDSQEFPKPVAQTVRDEPSGPSKIALAWLNGRLFYTTNGTDPRAPGGGVASAAREYSGPIAATESAMITSRVRSSYGLWSAPLRINGVDPARPESK